MNKNNEFRDLFLGISEHEYRTLPYVSYSALSSFDREGPVSIVRKQKDDIQAFAFGSLVDEMLLEQDNDMEDKFYMYNDDAPTASALLLANALVKRDDIDSDNKYDITTKVISELKLWKTTTSADVLKNKYDKASFWNYIEAKKQEAKGKYLIDKKMFSRALGKVTLLKEHKFTSEYFANPNDNGYFSQLKGLVNMHGIKFKFMLDLVKVDHEKKEIFPIDLKTSSSLAEQFESSFYKWRYWIQATAYRDALIEIIKGTMFKDYAVMPFKFIVVNSWTEDSPILYELPIKKAEGFNDYWTDKYGNKQRGVPKLIADYNWHRLNRIYDYSKETIDNNGIKILN